MVTEDFDEAVDFGVVVVEVRRETQQPLARSADDALLFEPAMPAQQRRLYGWWNRADDAGGLK